MSALEQSFRDICEKHDLTVFTVSALKYEDGGMRFAAAAYWDGFSRSGDAYEVCRGNTLSEAVSKTLDAVKLARTPPEALADEPLPVEG